jgi:acyl carrier protein
MDQSTLESKLVKTFITAFECDFNQQQIAAMRYKVDPAWDSFGHMSLMTQICIDFSVELTFEEMISLLSFEDCLNFLMRDR